MGEVNTTKLNADSHLLLDQPLLRLPLELQRRNFKRSQVLIDHEQKTTLSLLKDTAKNAGGQDPSQTLNSLDNMIARMERLKRRLEGLHGEEQQLHGQSARRIRHLEELYEIPSLVDVKYDNWSRTRLDRLVVDYLLRAGYSDAAAALAKAKDIPDLIDLNTFVSCHKIADSIRYGDTTEALQWIRDNRDALKKLLEKNGTINGTTATPAAIPKVSNIEFELRFQEYIELLRKIPDRSTAQYEAFMHAQKHLTPHSATHPDLINTASGLLAQNPLAPTEPYAKFFSKSRWAELSDLFIETHHQLFNLPTRPLLHIALSAGLSALKTPACHSAFNPTSSATSDHPKMALIAAAASSGTGDNDGSGGSGSGNPIGLSSIGTTLCPVCSIELNDLARTVPYAHHTKSSVESDAVMLPNSRVYGRQRLEELQRKHLRAQGLLSGGPNGQGEEKIGKDGTEVRDPTTGETFLWEQVKKVYIT